MGTLVPRERPQHQQHCCIHAVIGSSGAGKKAQASAASLHSRFTWGCRCPDQSPINTSIIAFSFQERFSRPGRNPSIASIIAFTLHKRALGARKNAPAPASLLSRFTSAAPASAASWHSRFTCGTWGFRCAGSGPASAASLRPCFRRFTGAIGALGARRKAQHQHHCIHVSHGAAGAGTKPPATPASLHS